MHNEAAMNTKRKKTSASRAAERTECAPASEEVLDFTRRYKREIERQRQRLIDQYRLEFAPQTREEVSAVEEIAHAHWGIQLLNRHEDILIDEQVVELTKEFPEAEYPDLVFKALDVLAGDDGRIAATGELDERYSRQYIDASRRLHLLRAKTESSKAN
jgi:hypothetical protein